MSSTKRFASPEAKQRSFSFVLLKYRGKRTTGCWCIEIKHFLSRWYLGMLYEYDHRHRIVTDWGWASEESFSVLHFIILFSMSGKMSFGGGGGLGVFDCPEVRGGFGFRSEESCCVSQVQNRR